MAFPEQQKQEEQVKRGNGPGVGALLKASRLRIGEDLRDISVVLCIRNVYLEAIEDGRFEVLPGPTYATGFIRAYAEYLGLDSDEVVRRFKADPAGGEDKAELIFPEPIPEPGIPGGAIVFIGILIAVVAYGAWYVNTSKEGFLVELISPVPERLAALAPNRQEPAADSGTPAKETAGDTAGDTAMPAGGKPSAEAAPMPEPAATMPASEAPSEAPTTAGEAAPESEAATGTAP
ncbi:MAG: helix-turn-helix domain-containing protein, partial [Proteobacteria bacterium]|nr:helix-turn-helix domain-containing protein [Pseudomonadota bacterium]